MPWPNSIVSNPSWVLISRSIASPVAWRAEFQQVEKEIIDWQSVWHFRQLRRNFVSGDEEPTTPNRPARSQVPARVRRVDRKRAARQGLKPLPQQLRKLPPQY